MAAAPRRNPCDMLEEAIKAIEREVENKQRRIETLRQRIEKLQAGGEPNTALIAELSEDVQELETELESDRPQLAGFQEEFSASCGPE